MPQKPYRHLWSQRECELNSPFDLFYQKVPLETHQELRRWHEYDSGLSLSLQHFGHQCQNQFDKCCRFGFVALILTTREHAERYFSQEMI